MHRADAVILRGRRLPFSRTKAPWPLRITGRTMAIRAFKLHLFLTRKLAEVPVD